MALKLFNKFVVFVTMSLLVLLTFALSVSAAEIDQEQVDSLDSDIVIAYEIPGNPEKIGEDVENHDKVDRDGHGWHIFKQPEENQPKDKRSPAAGTGGGNDPDPGFRAAYQRPDWICQGAFHGQTSRPSCVLQWLQGGGLPDGGGTVQSGHDRGGGEGGAGAHEEI